MQCCPLWHRCQHFTWALVPGPAASLPIQLSAHMPGNVAKNASSTWETWMKFLNPNFGLAWSWLLRSLGSEPANWRSFSLPPWTPSLLLYHSTFQTSKSLKIHILNGRNTNSQYICKNTTALAIKKMQIETTMRYHLTPVIKSNKCLQGYGEREW